MKIDRDGRGKIEKRTFRLTAREGSRLAAAIRRADLAHTRSPKSAGCCDFFFYSIRYRGHVVRWDDSARALPGPHRGPADDARAALHEVRAGLSSVRDCPG